MLTFEVYNVFIFLEGLSVKSNKISVGYSPKELRFIDFLLLKWNNIIVVELGWIVGNWDSYSAFHLRLFKHCPEWH